MTHVHKFLACMRQQGVPLVVAVVLWKLVGRRSRPPLTIRLSGGAYSKEYNALQVTNFSNDGLKAWIAYCKKQPALQNFNVPTDVPTTTEGLIVRIDAVIQRYKDSGPRSFLSPREARDAAAQAAEKRKTISKEKQPERSEVTKKQEKAQKKAEKEQEKKLKEITTCYERKEQIEKEIVTLQNHIATILETSFEAFHIQNLKSTRKSIRSFVDTANTSYLIHPNNPDNPEKLTVIKQQITEALASIEKLRKEKLTVPAGVTLDNNQPVNAIIRLLVHSPVMFKYVLTSDFSTVPLLQSLKKVIQHFICNDTKLTDVITEFTDLLSNNTTVFLIKREIANSIESATVPQPDVKFYSCEQNINWSDQRGYILRGGVTSNETGESDKKK